MNGTKVTENEVKLWQQKADEGLSARKIGNLFGRQHSTVLSYVVYHEFKGLKMA